MRERAALAIALVGVVLAPIVAPVVGTIPAVGFAALTSAVGIALFPERAAI